MAHDGAAAVMPGCFLLLISCCSSKRMRDAAAKLAQAWRRKALGCLVLRSVCIRVCVCVCDVRQLARGRAPFPGSQATHVHSPPSKDPPRGLRIGRSMRGLVLHHGK